MNVPISTVDDAHSKTGHDRTFFVRQSKLSPWQSIQGGDICSCLICNLINCFILFLVSRVSCGTLRYLIMAASLLQWYGVMIFTSKALWSATWRRYSPSAGRSPPSSKTSIPKLTKWFQLWKLRQSWNNPKPLSSMRQDSDLKHSDKT